MSSNLYLFHFRPSFDVLDVWLENLAKNLSLGRNPSMKLRYDIDHFKETVSIAKLDSPTSAKRIDLKLPLSRSPSPSPLNNKKPEFIWNNSQTEPQTIRTMDIDDSGPSSIIMPATDVSPSNGINFASSASNSSSKQTASSSFDNNKCSHSSSFSSNDKVIDQVPSTHENSLSSSECSPFIREIPKSPHLSKDFGENGERLRNSLRFRRQERLQKQRSLRSLANLMSQQSSSCSWDSGNENSISSANTDDFESDRGPNYFHFTKPSLCDPKNLKTIGKKPKPYGEKGFIIHVNDGSLTLNDVKDLNNCYSDDFDSSCDTSLNYIDPDSLNTTIENENTSHAVENKHFSPPSFKNSTFEIALPANDEPIEDKECHRNDEVRENLLKCRSKLDALEISDNSPKMTKKSSKVKTKQTKISLSDMLLPMKRDHNYHHQFDVVVTKSPNMSVFTRLHPMSSPNLNNNRTTIQKSPMNVDSPKRAPAKRNDAQNGTGHKMSQQRNYSKNTLAFIEKISDGLIERHQKTGQPLEKKVGNGKKVANSTMVQQQEVLTRKPPAPIVPKKIAATAAMPMASRIIDKQKKSNPSQKSPTRKRP